MTDVAGEHQIDRTGEVVAVLQKKWTLFGEENCEALIDGDLRLVGLDLAEVRIDCGVEHEAVVQDELGIKPCFGLQSAALKKRIVRVALIDIAESAQQSIW